MGLSNEISFILIFLAVPVQQAKIFCSKLAVGNVSPSVQCTYFCYVCKRAVNRKHNGMGKLKLQDDKIGIEISQSQKECHSRLVSNLSD